METKCSRGGDTFHTRCHAWTVHRSLKAHFSPEVTKNGKCDTNNAAKLLAI